MYANSKITQPGRTVTATATTRAARPMLAALAALAIVGTSMVVGSTAANAEACSINNCGQVRVNNTTSKSVRISDNIPYYNGNIVTLGGGQSSNSGQDWDTFEVPSGWCATYVFGDFRKGKTINTVDRRGGGTEWVKFSGYSSTVNVELDKTCTWNRAG